jgi:thiol-disulfide isomerase/thioredoxin
MPLMKSVKNLKVKKIFQIAKPWITIIMVFVVLRYSGLLSGLSFVANQALVQSGVMDIDPEGNVTVQNFKYDFTIRDLNDKVIDVSTFKGKVIFLNMWATWCGPCRAEMPSIQQVYDSVDHEKIAFIMLSLDVAENQTKVAGYVRDKSFTFPVYQPASALPNQLQVPTIPTTFVIGKDGKVKMKKSGTANYATEGFIKFLKDLSDEPASSTEK